MDCLHPITIVNPSKFISLDHRDRVLIRVRCGKCAACQQYNQKVWYLRCWYEFQHCIENKGYCLFDCLTYRPSDVPRISDYYDISPKHDYMCFDAEHLRLFFVRLRRKLRKYNIQDNLRYFAATEYGEKSTKRPHIHLLFFNYCPELDNITLSNAISDCWPYGRTDGLPYKSRKYVNRNTIGDDLQSSLRVCGYISKYVCKDSHFVKEIDRRINKILHSIFDKYRFYIQSKTYDDWLASADGQLLSRRITAQLSQFHRQSLHFGESALRDVDIAQILDDNLMIIPDQRQIKMRIGLPAYYKRKLFYELVEVDGLKIWQPTELGLKYKDKRQEDLKQRLRSEYQKAKFLGVEIADIDLLVDYVINYRGRIKADAPELLLLDKLELFDLVYNYSTIADKKQFGRRHISDHYKGNRTNYTSCLPDGMTLSDFISKYVYYDYEKEVTLSAIEKLDLKDSDGKQRNYDNQMRLRQLYKNL